MTGATLRARPAAVGPSKASSDRAERSRAAPISIHAHSEPPVAEPHGAVSDAVDPDPVAVGPAAPADQDPAADPLAGAISAFLTRSDGLFRAGGPQPLPAQPLPAQPQPAEPPGSVLPTAAGAPPPFAPPEPGASRLVRHVASAPRPTGPRPTTDPAPATGLPSTPIVNRNVPPPQPAVRTEPTRSPSPAAGFTVPPPSRPVSRVSIWFVGRDASRSSVQPGAVARLAPVIGGLLRERTRAEDRVAVVGGGRFLVDLPDTPIDGAAGLTRRLADSCDAWLAAEEPPLRLEFGMSESVVVGGPRAEGSDRTAGVDRRRPVSLDA